MPSWLPAVALVALALCSAAQGQVTAPQPIPRNALPAANANTAAKCLADYPGCSTCAKNAKGVFVCTVCKQYAPRVTTGYEDRTGTAVNEPFCDGVCMHYKLRGAVLEDDTSPCVGCTETGGCGTCKPGSFKTSDSYAMSRFALPSMPIACETCGACAPSKCSGTLGCQTCDTDAANKAYPKMKMPAAAATAADLDVCIADLCDDYDWEYVPGTSVDAAGRYIYPSNNNLYSNALNCKRQAKASDAGSPTTMLCTNQAGCTACKSGHFRTPNPIVPGTAMCVPCEGCGTAQCGANGCTACPNAVLNKRIAHPWGLTGMDGKAAMVCRNASNSVTPFKSRTGLLNTAIWPAPEFGGCPVGLGDFKINWWEGDQTSDITVAKWLQWGPEGASVEFQSNDTVKITFEAINNQRIKVTLQYKDRITQKPVTNTLWGVFPLSQTRVCITLQNTIAYNDANANLQMQVFFTTPATWNKRILLRLSGEPSFTLPIQGYKYGKVSVFGRRTGEPKFATVASLDTGFNLQAADWAKLVVYPEEDEWPALVTKAGTK